MLYTPVQSWKSTPSASNRFFLSCVVSSVSVVTVLLLMPALLTRMHRHFSRDSTSLTSFVMCSLLVTSNPFRGTISPSMSLLYVSLTLSSFSPLRPVM